MNFDPFRKIDFDNVADVDLADIGGPLKTCLEYWRSVSGEGGLPSWRGIDLSELPGDVLPLVTVINIDWSRGLVGADSFTYRYWGTGHVRAKNIERTGTTVAEHSDRARIVEAEYLRVIAEKRPIAFRKNIRINEPWRAVTQTSIRLPLSDDGVRVDNVLSASDWASIPPDV
ncbi:MAG: hypothetical protein JJ855_17180 [Rhodospirillales bacterium]|nr:hypothetical protein [Rhodospirillales bacterium]